MRKSTGELDFELKNTDDVHTFLQANEKEFDENSFCKLLNRLVRESGKSKFDIAALSGISEPYMYNLLKAEKHPARDVVIKLAIGLSLGLESSEHLLKLAGYSGFYIRHKRDSILKFAVDNQLGLTDTEDLLIKYGFSIMAD